MNETISKAVLAGLGFASMTRDAIRETAQHLVKQSRLSEEEGRRVVKEFQRRSAKAQKGLEKKVNAAVRKALRELDLLPGRHAKNAEPGGSKNSHARKRNARRARAQ